MQVRYVLWGLIVKDPVHEQILLFYFIYIQVVFVGSLFSPLNFWSVVRAVSGKINFTALLCREFNIFLRRSLHLFHTTDA